MLILSIIVRHVDGYNATLDTRKKTNNKGEYSNHKKENYNHNREYSTA